MISVVINTYNAEKYLAEVLESVKDFDEMVVCDMDSTDRTVDIARQYGCRVVHFPKGDINIAEPARDFAIHQATHPWVLVVDGDEIVPRPLREYLYNIIKQPDCPDGIYLPRRNYFMGHFMHAVYPDYILRFFRKEGTHWPPTVHSKPIVTGHTEHAPKHLRLALKHLSNDTLSSRLLKTDIYTDNEVDRKLNRHFGPWAFISRPTHRFIKSYFLKGGFRDGLPGFIYACLEATYQVVMMGKVLERQKK